MKKSSQDCPVVLRELYWCSMHAYELLALALPFSLRAFQEAQASVRESVCLLLWMQARSSFFSQEDDRPSPIFKRNIMRRGTSIIIFLP